MFWGAQIISTRLRVGALSIMVLLGLPGPASAGDPLGVEDTLQAIHSNWPEAQFSVDVAGLTDGNGVIDQTLQVEYESAQPGYVSLLRISSHGDIYLTRPATTPGVTGTIPVVIHPPLGHERTLFVFSERPLDELLSSGNSADSLGSDRAHALSVVQKIQKLQGQGVKLATRRYDYMVEAPAGQTQYTTRSIIREVEAANVKPGSALPAPRFPTRIEFEFNSDQLTEQSKRDLDVFGAALVSRLTDRKVLLEGHTDGIGTDEYNRDLSERRAVVARQYLVESFGLPAQQIRTVGKGKEEPIASNDTEAGRSRNRRVDFVFGAVTSNSPTGR